jgi:hypothetical protein
MLRSHWHWVEPHPCDEAKAVTSNFENESMRPTQTVKKLANTPLNDIYPMERASAPMQPAKLKSDGAHAHQCNQQDSTSQ